MSFSQSFISRLPPFEKFKKLNSLIIKPPMRRDPLIKKSDKKSHEYSSYNLNSLKKGLILNDSPFESKIKTDLRILFQDQFDGFDKICQDVINSKYERIYKQIYEFTLMSTNFSTEIFSSLIINTDQNSSSFFDGLKNFLRRKIKNDNKSRHYDMEHLIIPKGEVHFKDINKLFYDINIENLNYFLDEEYGNTKTRIIIIGEIHRIDSLALNLFLTRMMEYQSEENKMYNNILLFDVMYDPRSLFDKIKANLLCKMVFYSIENIPSKNIYKEVLYKFIYEKTSSLFIPNSKNTKIIIDYVNNHQISIESFKHYFKFLIFQFFMMHHWGNDEYLIFRQDIYKATEVEGKEEKKLQQIENFFAQGLDKIYSLTENNITNVEMYNQNDIKELSDVYLKHYNNRNIFHELYQMLEGLLMQLSENKEGFTEFNKYQFFFEFLQYGKTLKTQDTLQSRVNILKSYFEKFPNADYASLISKYIKPKFEELINRFKPNAFDELEKLKEFNTALKNILKCANDPKKLQTSIMILDNLMYWIKRLLSLNVFNNINEFDFDENAKKVKRKWVNPYIDYLHFYQIVNPAMPNIIMNTLLKEICGQEKDKMLTIKPKNFTYENTLTCFIKCFMKVGSNFILRYFFIEFLNEMGIDVDDDKEKDNIDKMKKIFLFFCYVFCLIGFFSRKRGNKDLFIKNYYSITNYYVRK